MSERWKITRIYLDCNDTLIEEIDELCYDGEMSLTDLARAHGALYCPICYTLAEVVAIIDVGIKVVD